MEINEALIARIVRIVVQVLQEQGLLGPEAAPTAGRPPGTCRTCGSGWRNDQAAPSADDDSTVVLKADPKKRLVVTEEDVRFYWQQGKRRLRVPDKAIVTPLAHDTAKDKKMEIIREQGKI
jgi:hypothetical protein